MKLIIDIDEEWYSNILASKDHIDKDDEAYLILNSTPYEERPQGYFDISKLRLMTVEECAGHTIDYAMGWKACIEWIKGGAE